MYATSQRVASECKPIAFGIEVFSRHLQADVVQPATGCRRHVGWPRDQHDLLRETSARWTNSQKRCRRAWRRDHLQAQLVAVEPNGALEILDHENDFDQ